MYCAVNLPNIEFDRAERPDAKDCISDLTLVKARSDRLLADSCCDIALVISPILAAIPDALNACDRLLNKDAALEAIAFSLMDCNNCLETVLRVAVAMFKLTD